mgnify:FL=1
MAAIRRQALLCFLGMLLAWPIAVRAQVLIAEFSPALVPWVTWVWLFVFCVGGWASSSLAMIAGWIDGNAEKRLQIVQRILLSLFAGGVAFFISQIAGRPEAEGFVTAFGCSFFGEKGLARFFPFAPFGSPHDRPPMDRFEPTQPMDRDAGPPRFPRPRDDR